MARSSRSFNGIMADAANKSLVSETTTAASEVITDGITTQSVSDNEVINPVDEFEGMDAKSLITLYATNKAQIDTLLAKSGRIEAAYKQRRRAGMANAMLTTTLSDAEIVAMFPETLGSNNTVFIKKRMVGDKAVWDNNQRKFVAIMGRSEGAAWLRSIGISSEGDSSSRVIHDLGYYIYNIVGCCWWDESGKSADYNTPPNADEVIIPAWDTVTTFTNSDVWKKTVADKTTANVNRKLYGIPMM